MLNLSPQNEKIYQCDNTSWRKNYEFCHRFYEANRLVLHGVNDSNSTIDDFGLVWRVSTPAIPLQNNARIIALDEYVSKIYLDVQDRCSGSRERLISKSWNLWQTKVMRYCRTDIYSKNENKRLDSDCRFKRSGKTLVGICIFSHRNPLLV